MNSPLRPEVEAAFAAALELSRAEQEVFLAREFAQYPEVRAEVEFLLRAYRAAGNFLEPGASGSTAGGILPAGVSLALPRAIGRYRILRLLGEGGMGVVYEAEQEQPRRTVALKVIKAAFASPELLRRFDQECQALGRLQHPGIAQIYEAGADNELGSRPYFAMELIHGTSLIEYADANQLTARGRLELISKVCEAVHHAHQRGVIHRDLKPGNILVDDSGQPKILDFGIARAANRDTGSSQHTGLGQLVGTLAYMSPEQVLAGSEEIEARSDVYALGVILFQLLAGRLPYQLSNQLHEAVQTIREVDPVPLSAISRSYRGDVETIVAMALEKDRTRRYCSAEELGADIRRYLQNEPILARRQSTTYQLQKFARRHRGLVAGVAAAFVVLIAGMIASAWEAALARHAEQHALHERDRAAAAERVATEERNHALLAEHVATTERNRAIAAETQAVRDRNRAVAEKQRADSESAIAKAVNSFLQNDLLAQASASGQARPDTKPDPDLKVRTALDRAAARITGHFENQPVLEAAIRQTIGNTYKELGLFLEAQRQLERAVDLRVRSLREEHADTLTAMNALAEIYDDQGKYAQSEPLYTKVLEVRRRVLGEKHPDTLFSMNGLALLYRHQGKYEQAETLYAKSLEGERRVLGEEHPDTLVTMNNLAVLYQIRNKLALAEPLLTQVLEVRRRVLGEEHPSTLVSLNTLALLYLNQGKYARAEPLFSKTLELRRRVLGEQHPNTLNSMNNLARLYMNQGRYAPAELIFVRVMELRERAQGNEHPESLLSINNLAVLYRAEGKYAQSEMLLRRALGIQQHVLGDEHPDTLLSMYNLGRLYQVEGKYQEAEQLFMKLVEIRRRVLGLDHPDTTNVLVSLGEIRLQQKRYAEAEQLLREALNGQEKRTPDAWQRCNSQSVLGNSLTVQAKFVEAEPLLLSGYKGLMQRRAMIPAESQSAVEQAGDRIVRLYLGWGKPEKAAEWQQRLQLATANDHFP